MPIVYFINISSINESARSRYSTWRRRNTHNNILTFYNLIFNIHFRLLNYAGLNRDVADPWYTGDFDATWNDVNAGCAALLKSLI